jgi:Flp pilus assembly protein TadD
MRRMKKTLAFAALLLWAGCVAPEPASLSSSLNTTSPTEAIATAKAEYRAGHYAKAAALAKRAVDADQGDAAALLVYAAALDRQHRFEQADAAYRALHGLIGDTAAFHNNYGYSMLLRGNLTQARKHFLLAQTASPQNATVRGNLTMLADAAGYAPSGAGMLQAQP